MQLAPLNALNDNMLGNIDVLSAMRGYEQQPQMQDDQFLKSIADLLPPQVLQQILASRVPEMVQMPQMSMPQAGMPPQQPGIDPQQLELVRQMLAKQQQPVMQ